MSAEEPFNPLKLENQLCFPLYACSRRVVGLYTPYLKPLGLTYTQYLVLMVLWERGEVSVGVLCKKLMLDSGTLTPLLKKMETEGLIHRVRSTADERIVNISLTEAGWQLRAKCEPIPAMVGHNVSMTFEESLVLYTLLYKILKGFDDA